MKGLNGKIAVVTGSSRGIGRAIAVRLAEEGCKIVINYSKDLDGAKETQKLVGDNSIIVKADVSKASECKKLIDGAVKKFGKVDILVNNAGVFDMKPLEEISEADWEKVVGTNSKSVLFCSKYAAEHMKNGSIVNIASYVAFRSRPMRSIYASSKSAVVGLTHSLAMELAPSIRVNAVAPGIIETGLSRHIVSNPEELKKRLSKIPLNRLGKPEDVACAVAFLASDGSSYVTGITLIVDGGMSVSAP